MEGIYDVNTGTRMVSGPACGDVREKGRGKLEGYRESSY